MLNDSREILGSLKIILIEILDHYVLKSMGIDVLLKTFAVLKRTHHGKNSSRTN